jgi:hypothetical protein
MMSCGINELATVGMIQLACYCGAELYFIGDKSTGQPPTDIIEQLKAKFESGDVGFFSSADGGYGECPCCGLSYELPDSSLMDWLPYMDQEQFTSTISKIKTASIGNKNQPLSQPPSHRYIL